VERITGGASTNAADLSADQIGKLIDGMKKLKRKRTAL
jgi:Na+/H+-translocating membrane pyrophosphatase